MQVAQPRTRIGMAGQADIPVRPVVILDPTPAGDTDSVRSGDSQVSYGLFETGTPPMCIEQRSRSIARGCFRDPWFTAYVRGVCSAAVTD